MKNWEMPEMKELMIEETACKPNPENCTEPGCPRHPENNEEALS